MPQDELLTPDGRRALTWLADAPLFIDEPQVQAFYDAVVRPETTEGSITLTTAQDLTVGSKATLEGGIEVSTGGFLSTLLPGLKASVNAGLEDDKETTDHDERVIELHPIDNPHRQLIHLTIHYQIQLSDRWKITEGFDNLDWAEPQFIAALPRSLLFLDVPALTPIVPAALERADGSVTTVFDQLGSEDQPVPDYPRWKPTVANEQLVMERQDYWKWFAENYSDTKAMIAVEKAAENSEGIRWIDYRIPIDSAGRTLHLHVQGRGRYDTGTFAYNLVKRGFKHGLRIVGTLKSEPDLNVLAIFDK